MGCDIENGDMKHKLEVSDDFERTYYHADVGKVLTSWSIVTVMHDDGAGQEEQQIMKSLGFCIKSCKCSQ